MERTLMIIKPDGVANGHMGEIITFLEKNDLRILGLKMVHLQRRVAGEFYAVHRGKGFYDDLLSYMTSGAVVVIAVQGENAVARMRTIIGATNPAEADPGTIRRLFAKSIEANAVHGSDSPENGRREVSFFFSEQELLELGRE